MKKILAILLLMPILCFANDKVPEEIYKKIIQKAEKAWPDDYEMQCYFIDKEVESYQILQKKKEYQK